METRKSRAWPLHRRARVSAIAESFRRRLFLRGSGHADRDTLDSHLYHLLVVFEVPQPLQHRAYNQWQRHGGVVENFREAPAFLRRHEFPPRNRFRVGAPAQAAPAYRLRANAQAVVVALERQLLVAAPSEQLRVNAELLRPVTRHAAPNGKNPHA